MSTVCGICRESYKDPCVVPCLHSYCRQCVHSRISDKQGKGFLCPECHAEFKITVKEVENLPPNYAINNLMPILTLHSKSKRNAHLQCENCDSKERAKGRCTDCKMFLCSFCVKAHKRINTLKGHRMQPVEAVKRAEPREMAKRLHCAKHQDEVLTLCCENCNGMICRDCTLQGHRGHEYVTISSVMDREKKAIQSAMDAANEIVPDLEEVLAVTKTMSTRVEKQIERTYSKVDNFIERQIAILEKVGEEFKQGVNTVGRTKLMLLGAQEKRLSLQLASTKSGMEFAKQTIRNTSDAEILTLKHHMISRLQQLARMPVDDRPCQDDGLDLKVNPSISVYDFMPRIAVIDSSTAVQSFCEMKFAGSDENIIYTTFCEQEWEIIVTLRDHFRKQLTRGGNHVKASIVEFPSGFMLKQAPCGCLYAEDNEDGTYSIRYKPPVAGVYRLAVKVDGYQIKGSPFEWNVAHQIRKGKSCLGNNQTVTYGKYQSGDFTTFGDIVIDGGYAFAWKIKLLESDDPENAGSGAAEACTVGFKTGVYQTQGNAEGSECGDTTLALQTIEDSVTGAAVNDSSTFPYATNAWYWSGGCIYTPHYHLNGVASKITGCEPGNVIALFFNPTDKTLSMFNSTTGQRDVIENITCPVSPLVTNLDMVTFNV